MTLSVYPTLVRGLFFTIKVDGKRPRKFLLLFDLLIVAKTKYNDLGNRVTSIFSNIE